MKVPKKQLNNLNVELVYLFGSQARDEAGPLSDYDFACLLSSSVKNQFQTKLELINLFSSVVKSDNVDIVILNESSVPLPLKYRIISEGEILYNIDDKIRSDFEYQTMHQYLDRKYYFDKNVNISLDAFAKSGLQ